MVELTTVNGMIIKRSPVGEYDFVVTILTSERGKITAFAKGSRRPGNHLAGSVEPFCFGEFSLYVGRTSYNIQQVNILNYFEYFRQDFTGSLYGMYFLELADYYTRENNDERQVLKLLYQSLRALESDKLDNRLVKCVYEIKSLVINGEFPGIPTDRPYDRSTAYTLEYIRTATVEKLFTFAVTEEVLLELEHICDIFRKRFIDRKLNSLEMLSTIV